MLFFNSVKFQNDLKTKAAQSTRPYIGISAQQNLDIVLPRKLTRTEKNRSIFLRPRPPHQLFISVSNDKLQTLKKQMLEKNVSEKCEQCS